MERTDDTPRDSLPGWSLRDRLMPPARGDESMVAASQQEIGVNNHIPVFLERTFRMIEQVPDDIVCWSTAGDSFVIKQVLVFEGILPSYFNHKKFMSFVRQLNFYGFKKIKGRASTHGTYGDEAAAAGATAAESWEEFRHPQFRRGRRDLLVGIKRQKDGGRLKRKRPDAQNSDIMSTLATDVNSLSGDLKAVKGKLDSIMSLLLDMVSGQNEAVPSKPVPPSRNRDTAAGEGEGGGGGGVRFGDGGSTASSFVAAESPASTARGGYGQWLVGGGSGGGGGGVTRKGGLDPYAYGAVFDYRTRPHLPAGQQQHGWHGHLVHSQLLEQPYGAEHYPAVPHKARHHMVQPRPLPPLAAAVAARASRSASAGPSDHQLPPLYPSRSKGSKSVASSSSSDRKQGGEGKGKISPKAGPQNRGDGSDGGVGTSPSSASVDADPYDSQDQQQQRRWRRRRWQQGSSMHSTQTSHNGETAIVVAAHGGGRCGAAPRRMQHGLSDGTRSLLQVLSQTAASATEMDKVKRANSINSSNSAGSTSSINSSGTQSSFEYD